MTLPQRASTGPPRRLGHVEIARHLETRLIATTSGHDATQ